MPEIATYVHVDPDDQVNAKIVEGLNGRPLVTVDIAFARGSVGGVTLFFDAEDLPVLRRLGVACIEAAYSLDHRHDTTATPPYEPDGAVLDGVEIATGRWACCGSDTQVGHADYCLTPVEQADEAADQGAADDVVVRP